MKEITDPYESLENVLAFSSKFWSDNPDEAWIYGIIMGWKGDTPEETTEIYNELKQKFRWTDEDVKRLEYLHEEYIRRRGIK